MQQPTGKTKQHEQLLGCNIKNILVMLRLMKDHCSKLAIHINLNFKTATAIAVAVLKFSMTWMAVGVRRLGSKRWILHTEYQVICY